MTDVNSRVRKHRTALRKAGLRPIQIWVPTRGGQNSRRSATVKRAKAGQTFGRIDADSILKVDRNLAVFLGIAN